LSRWRLARARARPSTDNKEIKRRENTAAVIRGCRRANHLQTADKQQAVRPSRGGGRQQVDHQILQVDRQDEQHHA
jgi:hypothetical protein